MLVILQLTAATDKMGYPDIYMNDAEIDNIYQDVRTSVTCLHVYLHLSRVIQHLIKSS